MNPFLAGLLVLVAVFGVILTLELTGKTDMGLKRLFAGREVQAGNTKGVVLSFQPLQPGQQVTKEVLWNPQQGTFYHTFVDKDRIAERGYLAGPEQVLGRVVRRPKAAGLAFVEDDFLPPGSPPGITGLVPDDMSALSIPADRVPGLELLGFADRFDLRMSVPSDENAKKVAREILEERRYASEADRLRLATIVRGPEPKLLAQAGAVLRPARGTVLRNEKIVVAVHPEDLNGLIAAIDSKSELYCSPRRKAAEGVGYERVEVVEHDPMDDYSWVLEISREVEMIEGEESEMQNVPAARRTLEDVARLGDDGDAK